MFTPHSNGYKTSPFSVGWVYFSDPQQILSPRPIHPAFKLQRIFHSEYLRTHRLNAISRSVLLESLAICSTFCVIFNLSSCFQWVFFGEDCFSTCNRLRGLVYLRYFVMFSINFIIFSILKNKFLWESLVGKHNKEYFWSIDMLHCLTKCILFLFGWWILIISEYFYMPVQHRYFCYCTYIYISIQ